MIGRQASTQIHNPTLRMCGVLHPTAHGLSTYIPLCPSATPELSHCILWLTRTLVSYHMAGRQESRKASCTLRHLELWHTLPHPSTSVLRMWQCELRSLPLHSLPHYSQSQTLLHTCHPVTSEQNDLFFSAYLLNHVSVKAPPLFCFYASPGINVSKRNRDRFRFLSV